VEPTPAPAWWKKKSVVWPSAAAVLAAAAAIVLAVNLAIFNRAADGPELQTLVAAVGTDRTIEPRVTGGFAYGPMRTVRSGEAGDSSLGPDIRIAVASIEKETADDRDAEALHARGIAFLVTGDIERAIATLEAGALERPEDARILSDLAAAYLVRSERDNRPGDLSKAVASVNRAMASDHLLPEALFNRAYALQRLSLTDEARDAWRAYLRVDDQSGWAAEARAHLRALGNQP
jgi:tetratricopeptide (TPR) repeat protein